MTIHHEATETGLASRTSQPFNDPATIRRFVLAGNALFTLKSLKTLKHFTFKVQRLLGEGGIAVSPPTWRVKVLAGRDNSKDYRFVGNLREMEQGQLPHFAYTSTNAGPATNGFAWCWHNLERCGERFEFHHAGKCGRCGRLLTVPESVASGIGPECAERMDFEAAGGAQGLLDQLLGG